MKKIFFLIVFAFALNIALAQHKTLTVYYSGDSTKVVNLSNTDSLVIFVCGASKVNYGGKDYNTVLIGDQCWLKENLDIGTMIQVSESQTNNSVLEKYCYNNDPNNCTIYGGLYQWGEAMQYVTTEGIKGICPEGWHIPTFIEFQTLRTLVNINSNALKEIGQGTGDGAGTNASGFSALLAGNSWGSGTFHNVGNTAFFWSSTQYNESFAWDMLMTYNNSYISFNGIPKAYVFSVRCLKN
jgi:uncharacterized protein (TIGR02145 family)